MAWAGAGMLWTVTGGVPTSKLLGQTNVQQGFQFVQISDSRIGFNKPANADVNATLRIAIDKINALPKAPDFLIHTGDLTHQTKPAEFDTLGQLLQGAKTKQCSMFRGNTTMRPMTARNAWRVTARQQKERAGTASTITACIS